MIEKNTVICSEMVVKDCCHICAGEEVNYNAVVSEFCQMNCNAFVTIEAILSTDTKLNYYAIWSRPVIARPNVVEDSFF